MELELELEFREGRSKMDKYLIIKRLEHIYKILDGEMRKLSGQLKADAQDDLKALNYAIELIAKQKE